MKIILNSRIIDSIELIKKSSSTHSSKKELLKLIDYINNKINLDKEININFICTHNSRRSIFSQIWAKVFSDYYGLQNLNIPESSDNLQSLSENNSISPIIESKSDQLAQNIFTPPTTENNKINLLPIPINQQQSQPTDGNVSVTAPKNTPQVTTTPVASTTSSVSFINMISNKQLSIG